MTDDFNKHQQFKFVEDALNKLSEVDGKVPNGTYTTLTMISRDVYDMVVQGLDNERHIFSDTKLRR